MNYTLSPDAHYPDTLVQANQALSYVIKHAETYGIDPSKMIFSGDSVGAQVSGQLVLLLTNQSYAKELGIVPANVDNHMVPKGFISVSGLLDTPEVGNTQLFATDWLFETLIRSYFQTNDVAHSEEVMESSILNNVNKQFPPTFMSDGNFGSFTKQAQALHHKLKHLGVDSQLVVFDQSEALLFHVFELKVENSYAQKVHTAQLDFMASVLGQ
ncbi:MULTISPECIES: alpha/beta hydrolase [unclassified Staphylococcus]|uniref:alpha/beta hydrolase n=1 Tax=unclassified Staphylococcus TaxID=91994 RepID=UPI0021D05B42|nr:MULTISPECIES: alpha/beta hydrolase [unclassified Staphylococcus]UXR77268.1 alpha/beta hydrolase [Staphylococcus sp. IVB6233]UXR81431.1 alpha/beta hydrolase [Staphylococcus sp. IVB6218]